jgi:hypothetical protein
MANLTTTYNSSIKEKIFVLKGEEGYARTTDMILNVLEYENSYDSIEYMRVGLSMNVLRDIGESTIVIYNGENVLRTIPWSDTPSQMTFDEDLTWDDENQLLIWGDSDDTSTGLRFPYEEENKIYARYMGSKQCMMSVSETYDLTKPVPPKYSSALANVATTNTYDVDGQFTLLVEWTCSSPVSHQRTCTVKLYVDGEEYNTYNGNISANQTSKTFYITVNGSSMTQIQNGFHHIRVVYLGDEYTSSSEVEFDISLGYNLQLVSYDSPFLYSQNWVGEPWNRVSLNLSDFFGNPISSEDVTLTVQSPQGSINMYSSTDEMGNVTFATYENQEVMSLLINASTINVTAYTSNTTAEYEVSGIIIPVFTYGSVSLATSRDVIAPNVSTDITATLTPVYENVPVFFGDVFGTAYTDSDGVATFSLTGNGNGMKNIMGSVGSEIYDFVQVQDYLQYWTINNTYNQNVDLLNATINKEAVRGFVMKPNNSGSDPYMLLKDNNITLHSKNISWTVDFDITDIVECQSLLIQTEKVNASKNDHIRVEKIAMSEQPTKIRVYRNGTLVKDKTSLVDYPMVGFLRVQNAKSPQLAFNNLKLIWYPKDTDFDGA